MNEIKELRYGNTRCYCINNKVLVDTDWAGTLPAFFKCVKEKGIALEKIEYLMITHFHPNHMGIAQQIADLGVRLMVFEPQKDFMHRSDHIFAKNQAVPFKPIEDQKVCLLSCADSRAWLAKLGIEGEVIHTVGHSEDSVSLILDNGIAIVGDLYPLSTVSACHDPHLEQSWRSILLHNVTEIHYGHFKEEWV